MEDFTVKNDDNQGIKEISSNKKSVFQGVIEVFYNPTKLFTRIKDNPQILIPYIFYIVITFVFLYLISDLIVQSQIQSEEFKTRTQGVEVTDDMIASMKQFMIILGVLFWAMLPLVTAGLASFWGNFIMAGKVGFKHILSVSLYSELLFVIGSLLIVPMMLSKGTLMVTLSPAVFVADQGIDSLVYVALSKLSLFHIWEIVVSGIGFSIIFNFKRNKGYILSVLSVGLLSVSHIVVKAIGEILA
jgi:hypothetical protein